MDITKLSIKRPVAIIMAMLVMVVLGVVSITKMDTAFSPEVDMPIAMIMTTYRDAAPEEVENLVTEYIESAISNVENVDTITSTSSEGLSMVTAEFDYGTDMNNAVNDIRDKISSIEMLLPDNCDSPSIMKMDMNSSSVLTAVVSSESMNEYELKTFVEDNIQPRIERQKGVGSVEVTGGVEKEIKIEIDQERMEGLGLTMATIGNILSLENSNQSGGSIAYGEKSLTISTKLKMESIEDIQKTPIPISSGVVLKLEDIANITECDKEITSISRYNGEKCISVSVKKSSDGNDVSVVNTVKAEIASIVKQYPDITMEVINESASTIENGIHTVMSNIIIGAVLSVVVLFVFLKNIGLTGVIAVSMPISIIGAFVFLYFSGTTINMFSLGGLSVGVGMLVDNSVVVLENIYRYRTSLGFEKIKGTYRAGKEVRASIIASTLTTVVVFVPFIFTSGMVIEMMSDLAFAIIFSLSMSLLTSMTVVPMLAGNYVNNIHRNQAPKWIGFANTMFDLFDRSIQKLSSVYEIFLKWAVYHKKRTLFTIFILFSVSLCMVPSIGLELMPQSDESKFNVTVKAPKSSKIETIDALSLQTEQILNEIPELKSMFVSISNNSSESNIVCELVDKNERERSTEEIIEGVRTTTKNIAGADIRVSASSSMSAMMGGGVTVEIVGEDMNKLQQISEQIILQMEQVEGTRQIESSIEEQDIQIALKINKDKIRQYGLTGFDVASQIRNTVSGYTAATLKTEGSEMDIRIVYPEEYVSNMVNIENMSIAVGNGVYLPLSSMVDVSICEVPSSIDRKNQSRYVTVTCEVYGRDSGSVANDVEKVISQMNIPKGYYAKLGGSNEMMNDTFSSLATIIILAILFVYMVMAAQFESVINPFIILFTIPLAFTGAIFLLFVAGEAISMMALVGCLVLVGIVVNNGIVLIDYIDTLRNRDNYKITEAVLTACPTRLRPILMTAVTTILGQLPMIFSNGSSSEVLKGMGLVIAGGLATSTVLTLVVVPLLYMIFDRISNFFRKRMKLKTRLNPYEIEKECC